MAKTKSKALAVRNAENRLTVERVEAANRTLLSTLTTLGSAFDSSSGASDMVVSQSYESLYAMNKMLERTLELGKGALLDVLRKHGEKVTDAGTLRAVHGGYVLEARPTRTGTDAKKLEALLRVKGINPASYMEARLTYAVEPAGIAKALAERTLTLDELKKCEYEPSYSLQPLKKWTPDED